MNVVPLGDRFVRVPDGMSASLYAGAGGDSSSAFVETSPDRTVYHSRAWLDMSRRENGAAELLILARDGRPAVGLPMHRHGRWFYRAGYTGMLFPPGRSESVLAESAGMLGSFLDANPRLGYESQQSAQAPAYDDTERHGLLDSLLASLGKPGKTLFTRIKHLTSDQRALPASDSVALGELENELLVSYDGKKRSEVRQALRHGAAVSFDLLCGDDPQRTQTAYDQYVKLHAPSWSRTGMQPHAAEYWYTLSHAIQAGGGRDLVVVVRDAGGAAVAGVTCHIFGSRAIYWSGCSLPEGLRLKANPLCLHAAMTLCGRAGATVFELGRFDPAESSEKERAVTAYKAQFKGSLVRVINFVRAPAAAVYRAEALAMRLARTLRGQTRV